MMLGYLHHQRHCRCYRLHLGGSSSWPNGVAAGGPISLIQKAKPKQLDEELSLHSEASAGLPVCTNREDLQPHTFILWLMQMRGPILYTKIYQCLSRWTTLTLVELHVEPFKGMQVWKHMKLLQFFWSKKQCLCRNCLPPFQGDLCVKLVTDCMSTLAVKHS